VARLYPILAFLAALFIGLPVSAADGSGPKADDDARAACLRPSRFVKIGQLSDHDAAAIVMCNGGSGEGSSVRFFVNFGPQLGGTVYLGEVAGGNLMSVFFDGGYAYVTSALHGPMLNAAGIATNDPSACNQCYTRMLVQRVAARETSESPGPLLIDEGITVINLTDTLDYRRQARGALYKQSAMFGGKVLRSKDFVRSVKSSAP
jgi:hypothetical protein